MKNFVEEKPLRKFCVQILRACLIRGDILEKLNFKRRWNWPGSLLRRQKRLHREEGSEFK